MTRRARGRRRHLQGDLAHRQIEIEDEADGERLRPGFDALGWATERLAWMLLDGPPPAGPDFEEVPFAADGVAADRVGARGSGAPDEAAAQSFTEHEDSVAALRARRALLARDDAGAPVGFASFGTHGDGAEIEQVYVSPPTAAAAWAGAGSGGRPHGRRDRNVHYCRRRGRFKAPLRPARVRARVGPARLHAPAALAHGEPAAARVVGRPAQVAAEGGVGDRADVPRVRVLGRDGHGEVGGPAGALRRTGPPAPPS